MANCTVQGLWNQVHGIPPFLSEQEYMEEDINLLCQLLGGIVGSGSNPQVFVGDGPPVGLQVGQSPILAATYYDRLEGMVAYPWDPTLNGGNGGWVGI